MSGFKQRVSRNAKAMTSSVKFSAYAIIVLVVLYADVMFVSLMWSAFPGGFLTIAAIGGAFATGLSVIALVIGKSRWFRPGGQLIWAWAFTVMELAVSMLNVTVSVLKATNQPLGYLSIWMDCAPATPIVALVGWMFILFLDREREQMHEQMEMQDDLADMEREHERNVHEARMEIKQTALSQQKEYMKSYLNDAAVQDVLRAGSLDITRAIVSEIIQRPIMPTLPTGPVVPSLPPAPVDRKPEPEKKQEPLPVFNAPKQPDQEEMRSWFKQMVDEERQKRDDERKQKEAEEADAAKKAAPAPAPQPSYADDLAESVPPAQPEQQYKVNKPKEPITENLAPFPVAPTQQGNGASRNGHHHLSPMME